MHSMLVTTFTFFEGIFSIKSSITYKPLSHSEAVVARRLREAAEEIGNYSAYDYIVVNREVEPAVDTLASIVKAERVRRSRMEGEIRPILATFE